MPEDDHQGGNDAAALRWTEGRRRYELIRKLVEGDRRPLPATEIKEIASALGLSQTTIYRLVRLYRKHGTIDALEPRPRGRPEGSRVLSRRVETIIAEVIETVSLERTRPTLTYLVERIHARCAAEGLSLPHRRTIRARYLAREPQRSPLRRGRGAV